MITTTDIQNLADLARIKIENNEANSLASEIDYILRYVSQIENMKADGGLEVSIQRNIVREDVVIHDSSQYTDDILKNAPAREGNLLKVKKILQEVESKK